MPTTRERIEGEVAEALVEARHSGKKWDGLRSVLMEVFDLPQDDVRCGLISKGKNATNRAQKDVAWQNPRVLALVVEPDSDVSVEQAERSVLGFAAKYARRHDDLPRLRVCLIFDGVRLAKLLRLAPPGVVGDAMVAVVPPEELDEEDDEVDE